MILPPEPELELPAVRLVLPDIPCESPEDSRTFPELVVD
jgi:hypothetical protein